MKNCVLLSSLAAIAGLAQGVAAQGTTTGATVTYTMTVEVIGGDLALPLGPGESAMIKISSDCSNLQTTTTWSPVNQPNPGSGTIRGFAGAFLDLNGTSNNAGNANGAWNTDAANPGSGPIAGGWDLVGTAGWGTPFNAGSQLRDIQYGQFPTSNSAVLTSNPLVNVYQALWTPDSYTNRTVTFTLAKALVAAGSASTVIVRTVGTTVGSVFCSSVFGSIDIPIAPAPSSLALLGLGGLIAGRRRRA